MRGYAITRCQRLPEARDDKRRKDAKERASAIGVEFGSSGLCLLLTQQ